MKYLVYEADQMLNTMIYCNKNGDETPEDIAKAIVTEFFVGKFNKEEHKNAGCPRIENDENLFILRDAHGCDNIWQICGKVSDYTQAIIPNLYRVKRIGLLFE